MLRNLTIRHCRLARASPPPPPRPSPMRNCRKPIPAVGGTVTASPREIRLKFSEGRGAAFLGHRLGDAGGRGRDDRQAGRRSRRQQHVHRADQPAAQARRLHSHVACGLGRHAQDPGQLHFHPGAVNPGVAAIFARSPPTMKEKIMARFSSIALAARLVAGRRFRFRPGIQGWRHHDRQGLVARDAERRGGRRRLSCHPQSWRDGGQIDRRLCRFRRRRFGS